MVVLSYSALPSLTVLGAVSSADSDFVDSGSFAVVLAVVNSDYADLSGHSDTVAAAMVSSAICHCSFAHIH